MDSWSICSKSWPTLSGCTIVITINSLLCLGWFIISITREKPIFLQMQVVSVSSLACSASFVKRWPDSEESESSSSRATRNPFPTFSFSPCHFLFLSSILSLSSHTYFDDSHEIQGGLQMEVGQLTLICFISHCICWLFHWDLRSWHKVKHIPNKHLKYRINQIVDKMVSLIIWAL